MSVDWTDVYRNTYPDLVRFLHRKVWDVERAQDLAQEAFVRALRHEPKKPRAWLFQVAANLARDEARTVIRRKRHLTLLKSETEDLQASAPDLNDQLSEQERMVRVKAALEGLSDRDRDVLLLWDAGQSYRKLPGRRGWRWGRLGPRSHVPAAV